MAINVVYIHGIGEMGGAEKDLLSYLVLLNREEFSPHVVCPETGPLIEEVRSLHVPVLGVQFPAWRKLKDRVHFPLVVWKLVQIFREWKIDLIHVNDYWWAPVACLASRFCRIPVVVHLRQQIEPVRIKQYWLHQPDFLFPVSKDIERVLLSMAIEPSRIHVAYSGIDLDHFCNKANEQKFRDRYGLKAHQPIIGSVANLFPRKGYEYLIEALVPVKKAYPDIRCFILGEGPEAYHQQLVRLVEKHQLSSQVIFAGFQRDVFEFVNSFDVFVLPSLMEGFGIALLEAMAMSKPIVACKVGGVPEFIVDGVTGMLVPPKNSKALADALISLLGNEQVKSRLGLAARKVAENRFSQETAMQRIQTLYHQVADGRHINSCA